MDKLFLPPISVEQFAAYLDGNLSKDEMLRFADLASNNEDIAHLLDANSAVNETLLSYDNMDNLLPEEISNMDFELPDLENVENFKVEDDSFLENNNLYQQEESCEGADIIDEVFNDMDIEYADDMDIDVNDIDILDMFD